MASTNLKSIPFFSDDWVKQLNEAGYFTTDSLQNETAEQLIKKLSFRNKSNNFTLDICKMIIDFSKRTMEEYPKQNAFEITSNFFDENDLQDWSEFEKKSALEFLSLELFQHYDAGIADFDNSNIFLINTSDNIDLLTKKSIFLPTIPTISFQNNNSIIQIDHQQGYDIETGEEGEYQFFCHLPDRDKSADWFWSAKPLLQSGLVQYIPNIVVDKELYDGTRKIIDERYTIKTKECTASPRESYLNDIGIKSLQIEIPYIDDIPLSLFSEISYNETDALRSFRSFFSKNIRAIDFSKISEIVDFEESMKEEVGKIQNKILREQKKVARKHFINVFGTSVALLVTLIVFNDQQELIECLAGLGSIGLGLKKFISDSTDYFVQKVDAEDNACWYLWLLNESKSS